MANATNWMEGAANNGPAHTNEMGEDLIQFLSRNGYAVPTELVAAYTQQQQAYHPSSPSIPPPDFSTTRSREDKEAVAPSCRASEYGLHGNIFTSHPQRAPQPHACAP